jgi:hypothetical protein
MRRVPWELVALPALGISRLLPDSSWGLWVRLAAATACLLLPGALIARGLRVPSVSAALAWSLAALFAAMAVVFALHASLGLALVLLGVVVVGALAWPWRRPVRQGQTTPGLSLGVALAGVGLGIALWTITTHLVGGDDFFHLARVRKLDDFGGLSLRAVDEFRDGGLHPGYAFPLWHAFLALVARLAGVDPTGVVLHEASVLVPVAFLVAWEAGREVFRSAWGGLAVLLAQVAMFGLAAGHGASYRALALPATVGRQLLVPAVIALFFASVARQADRAGGRIDHAPGPASGLATLAVAAGALALVHPTYAVFVLIPLAGYVVARLVLARAEPVEGVLALLAVVLPSAAVALWLRPIARETASVSPSSDELTRALQHYKGQLDVFSDGSYRLAPEVLGRAGAVAVLALFAVPLAAFAARRRWGAFVIGGFLAVLVIVLLPSLFTHFADAVSVSQARRVAGFVPFPFAVAGGAAVLARMLSIGALPVGLGAGIAFQLAYPGDFGYGLDDGGPALATWVALFGGAAALVLGLLLPRRLTELDRVGTIAAATTALAILPAALHGFTHWDERPPAVRSPTPGLVAALRDRVPEKAVVFSDDTTSYAIAAFAPVYVANALPGHVADTQANRPYARRADAQAFFGSGNLAIPRRYGATWLVVDRKRTKLRPDLPQVYSDARYVLYRLRS